MILLTNENYRPETKEELFNLRHASARNVIERIFGVLKQRFRILLLPPQYKLDIQIRVPVALSALHNFIRDHSPVEDIPELDINIHDTNHGDNFPGTAAAVAEDVGEDVARIRRDRIATQMW